MTILLYNKLDHKLENIDIELLKIVEIRLDSHTIYLSERDIEINNIPYIGIVKNIDGIKTSREIDLGLEQTQDITITIVNNEFRFQDLLQSEEIINRKLVIKELDPTLDNIFVKPNRHIDLFIGVIDNYSWDNDTFTLHVADIARKINDILPRYTIQKSIWPNAVDVGKSYPIIGGLVTKVPIYYIDNVNFQYLAALIPSGLTIRSEKDDGTFKVYYWDNQTGTPGSSSGGDWIEINSSNYVVSKITDTNNIGVFVIDFSVDMGKFELAIDIEGIEDATPSIYTLNGGSLIINHADFERLLYQNSDFLNIDNNDINVPMFRKARQDLDTIFTNPPTVSFWLGEQKNSEFIFQDLAIAMRKSMPTITGISEPLKLIDGSWQIGDGTVIGGGGMSIELKINPKISNNPYVFVCDNDNIVGNINISTRDLSELKNDITVNADFEHSKNKFRKSSNQPSTLSQTKYKTTNSYTYDCLSISIQNELDELAQDLRDDEKNLPLIVDFKLNKTGLKLDRSDIIAITNKEGIGKSFKQIDGTWVLGDVHEEDETILGKKHFKGWYRKKAEILSLSKNKSTVDITAKMI